MCIHDVFANVETELVHIFLVVVFTRQLFVHMPIFCLNTCCLNTRKEDFCNKNCTKICSFFDCVNVCISFNGNTQCVLYVIICATTRRKYNFTNVPLSDFISCVCAFTYLPSLKIFKANTRSSSLPCCLVECSCTCKSYTWTHLYWNTWKILGRTQISEPGCDTCWLEPSSRFLLALCCDRKSM